MTRLVDDGLIREVVVNCMGEIVNYLKYISATGTASYVTCRDRERDWEYMVEIANCEVFKKSILLFVNKGLPFDEIKSQQLVCPNMSLQLNLLVAN